MGFVFDRQICGCVGGNISSYVGGWVCRWVVGPVGKSGCVFRYEYRPIDIQMC
jgi:hypothetical protein